MSPWTCPACHARNDPAHPACESCGASHQKPRTLSCPFDGAILNANGFCPSGDGFPITLALCPDSCPACRRTLRWDGDCDSCRPASEKPGHRYAYRPFSRDDTHSGHWRVAVRGPQPIAAPTHDQLAALTALLSTSPREAPPSPTPTRAPLRALLRVASL